MRFRRFARLVVGALCAVGAVIGIVIGVVATVVVVGMRTKSPRVRGAVRRMNKAYMNPRQMVTAGTPGAYASVIHHVGRRSGNAYATPVVPAETDDGFVIALPYGTHTDWVQNVLAAGRVSLTHDGRVHEVDHPEVVPTEQVEDYFGASERWAHRAMHVDECLRLHRVA